MQSIQMVDLKGQYEKIKSEVDAALSDCLQATSFINGPQVKSFSDALSAYLDNAFVIPCANGTDALQIAMMGLGLERGDEVIVPAFTYVATAEVIGLLGLVPVMVDVDPRTFNITAAAIEAAITPRTKAVVPVHLFGQCADMEPIVALCRKHGLWIIEDTAQAIGAVYTFSDNTKKTAGCMGDAGCTSFFPSKNLGCYGDGGAVYTTSKELGATIKMIANHGQQEKYVHKLIGVNSRLDSLQAAVLNVKLKYLNDYTGARQRAAALYNELLAGIDWLVTPYVAANTTHVYHQYTLLVKNNQRDALKEHLHKKGIPSMVYYPVPLNKQEAYLNIGKVSGSLNVTEELCKSVLSLPMHTELGRQEQEAIADAIKEFQSW